MHQSKNSIKKRKMNGEEGFLCEFENLEFLKINP